jgi:hypothetical protein
MSGCTQCNDIHPTGGGVWLLSRELIDDEPRWCGQHDVFDWDYETLLFGVGPLNGWGRNWRTREDALRGHWGIVERLRTRRHPDTEVLFTAPGWEHDVAWPTTNGRPA